jgi:Protein of unknown function (DUF1592)/Protein of unknown function (DUF1588)/Protein of unknown function (DUF1595)/Protein of unknown function (DUF1585)/Protein of unknown function (DUF1587)
MRARSTWSLALFVVSLSGLTLGCAGAVGGGGPGVGNGGGTNGSTAGTNGGTGGTGPGSSGTTGGGTAGGGGTSPGTGGSSPGTGGTVTLPGSALQSAPVFRLTNYEYMHSAADLLGLPVSVELEGDGASDGGFWIGGPASDNSVRAYHAAAIAVATTAVTPTNLARIVPCSATPTAACAGTFIDSFGPKAFRRPLDPAEKTALTSAFMTIFTKYGFPAGIQTVIEAILQSPSFLYHLELEEQALGAGKKPVTGYSMASRLSYLLWSSTPDDTLLAHAGGGMLSTAAQVQAEATRMLADPRAKNGVRYFYEQWLRVTEMSPSKTAPFDAKYTPSLINSIKTSFDMQMDDALWADTGAVTALLTSRTAYVNQELAPIMGVTGITGATMQKVQVNATQRAGVLTHPAIMSTFATENTSHPIKRGVFVWGKVLCRPLPDPPANVPPFVAPAPGQSLRQDFEVLTKDPVACQPCHMRINPVGFLFENYDAIGQFRTTDDNNQPVNSAVTIVGTGDAALDVATTNATQFLDRLGTDDAAVGACMITHLYRFAAKRAEATSGADNTDIMKLQTAFKSSQQSFKQVLLGLTQTEIFLNRLNVL